MPAAIKICGLTDEAAIHAVNRNEVEFAGFVYYPSSPRHLPLLKAAALKSVLDKNIRSVSVLVNPDDALVDEVMATLAPDYIQLHGKEPAEQLATIKNRFPNVKIIKAIAIRNSDDVARAMHYSATADMLLFDAKPPAVYMPSSCGPQSGSTGSHATDGDPAQVLRPSQDDDKKWLPGGNGLAFDWALLKNRDFPLPWMLSGGLNEANIAEAISGSGAKAVDVSSGVESAPGVKDAALIEAFVKAARKA